MTDQLALSPIEQLRLDWDKITSSVSRLSIVRSELAMHHRHQDELHDAYLDIPTEILNFEHYVTVQEEIDGNIRQQELVQGLIRNLETEMRQLEHFLVFNTPENFYFKFGDVFMRNAHQRIEINAWDKRPSQRTSGRLE